LATSLIPKDVLRVLAGSEVLNGMLSVALAIDEPAMTARTMQEAKITNTDLIVAKYRESHFFAIGTALWLTASYTLREAIKAQAGS